MRYTCHRWKRGEVQEEQSGCAAAFKAAHAKKAAHSGAMSRCSVCRALRMPRHLPAAKLENFARHATRLGGGEVLARWWERRRRRWRGAARDGEGGGEVGRRAIPPSPATMPLRRSLLPRRCFERHPVLTCCSRPSRPSYPSIHLCIPRMFIISSPSGHHGRHYHGAYRQPSRYRSSALFINLHMVKAAR